MPSTVQEAVPRPQRRTARVRANTGHPRRVDDLLPPSSAHLFRRSPSRRTGIFTSVLATPNTPAEKTDGFSCPLDGLRRHGSGGWRAHAYNEAHETIRSALKMEDGIWAQLFWGHDISLCRCNAGQSRRYSSCLFQPTAGRHPQGDRGVVGLPMLGEGVYAGELCTFGWRGENQDSPAMICSVLYLGLPFLLVLAIRHIHAAPPSAAHLVLGFWTAHCVGHRFLSVVYFSPLISFSGS